MATPTTSTNLEVWSKIVIGVFVPLVVAALTMLYTSFNKLDDRQFALQGSAITAEKLAKTETRITEYVNVRLNDLSSKLDNMSDQQAKTNDILINLASGMNNNNKK